MKKPTELERLKAERKRDAEWLAKYKRIVDGLQTIAEVKAEAVNEGFDAWLAVSGGLATLSQWIKEDIEARKEDTNG